MKKRMQILQPLENCYGGSALNRQILHGRNCIATAEEWRKRDILHPFANCIFIFHSCRFLSTICPYNEFNDQIRLEPASGYVRVYGLLLGFTSSE